MPLGVILGYFQSQYSRLDSGTSTIEISSHMTNLWKASVSTCSSGLPTWGFVMAIVCGILTAVVDIAIAQTPRVRVAYIIPSDRSAQSGAVANLQQFIPIMRDWYKEQMDRYGFGEKSFIYETEADGVTPLIHVVPVTMTASDIRSNSWNQTLTAASNAGVPIWTTGQVWLLIPESHLQAANGSISGGVALGASFGSGMDPGVALIGGDALFRLSASRLNDNAAYQGQIVPQIGPFPLVQSVSFPWFEGNTFSSITSSIQGAVAHELGHAFGLGHDFRNDSNFRGNLMGNGLRGWRGSVLPELYPNDDSQLSYAAALALNTSRYFNGAPGSDQVRPNVTVSTTGLTPLVDGKLLVNFTASDTSGLAAALLSRDGNVIDELVLGGTTVSTAFATPYFTSNQSSEYLIRVYDTQGNVQSRTVNITPQGGPNVAPQPFLSISPTTIVTGQSLLLSAAGTVDPNHSLGQLQFEWDVDGDGIFTAPSSQSTFLANFNSAGPRLARVRVTDPQGAWAVSAPLAVRVISGEASISQSYVYYSGSPLEAGGIEAALDTSKSLVRETSEPQTLDFTSLINSQRGINGVVFDIDGLSAATLSPVDFMFQISPQGAFNQAANPPVDWQEAPSPSSIVVQSGSPSRVILKWPDNSINNRWLRLTIKANSSTGLVEPAVFYLGHLLGETNGLDGGIYTTAFADIPPIRSAVGTSVNASSPVDIDKNGLVSFADISVMRANVGSQLTNITVQSE